MRVLALLVIVLTAGAPVLAAASVPDPTWIAGVYDGGDGDEIVILVWDGTPAIAPTPPTLSAATTALFAVASAARARPARVAPTADSRAPPLA
jgi:hypothetical protein